MTRPILLGEVPDNLGGYVKVFADIDDAALVQAVGSVFGAESLPDGAVHDVLSVRLVHFPAVAITAACIAIVPDNPRIASYARGKTIPACEHHGRSLFTLGATLRGFAPEERGQRCAVCVGAKAADAEVPCCVTGSSCDEPGVECGNDPGCVHTATR